MMKFIYRKENVIYICACKCMCVYVYLPRCSLRVRVRVYVCTYMCVCVYTHLPAISCLSVRNFPRSSSSCLLSPSSTLSWSPLSCTSASSWLTLRRTSSNSLWKPDLRREGVGGQRSC